MVTHGFGLSLVPAMLPRISDSLGSGYRVLGLVVATALFAYSPGALLAPKVLRHVDLRTVLIATFALTGGALLLAAVVPSAPLLALCVAILGISAPLNWTATLQSAYEVVKPHRQGVVLSVASSGSGLGAAMNGIFIWALAGPDSWRWAFFAAATAAAVVAIATPVLIKHPLGSLSHSRDPFASPPSSVMGSPSGRKSVWADPVSRVVILSSIGTAVMVFPITSYLSTVGVEEFRSSSALLWLVVGLGALSVSAPIGWLADRTSPMRAAWTMASLYMVILLATASFWTYPVWLLTAVGLAVFHYPIWGLFAMTAQQTLYREYGTRSITTGLALAAIAGGGVTSVAGAWFEASSTLRPAVTLLSVGMVLFVLWLTYLHRWGCFAQRPPPGLPFSESTGKPS